MPRNECKTCGGFGVIGWLWWKKNCEACGGDGYCKPPGWPDRDEIERLRPKPNWSGPPPKMPDPPPLVIVVEGSLQRRCVKCRRKTGNVLKDAPGICPKCASPSPPQEPKQ